MLEKDYVENIVIVYLYKYMGHKTITETCEIVNTTFIYVIAFTMRIKIQ